MKEIIYQLRSWIKLLSEELYLFFQGPKRYIFLFTYPKNIRVKIEDYDSHIYKIGKTLVGKIKKLYPRLKVHFIGSAALGISGQRDIDLLIECIPENFDKYLPGLITLFGLPAKRKKNFVQWEAVIKKSNVDVLLSDPSGDLFRMCLYDFKVLKKNRNYLAEYKQLKLESKGLSIREYQKKKLVFFNKIWSNK